MNAENDSSSVDDLAIAYKPKLLRLPLTTPSSSALDPSTLNLHISVHWNTSSIDLGARIYSKKQEYIHLDRWTDFHLENTLIRE